MTPSIQGPSSARGYGLLRTNSTSGGDELYDVTPVGKQYDEWMQQQEGEAVERVEAEVRRLWTGEASRNDIGRVREVDGRGV